MPTPPLPVRDGLNPTRIRLPDTADPWRTVIDYLTARFPADADRLREKVAAGEVVDATGAPITDATVLVPRSDIYLYRDPPDEAVVPFDIPVLHQDDSLVVVDKPHFLATTPRGRFVVQTALVLLRRRLEMPDLSPAHRLDRLTAGVLIFTTAPHLRRPYQELFAQRSVTKIYEAIATIPTATKFPLTVRSRIIKERGSLQATEEPGEANTETVVEFAGSVGDRGLYVLHPHTGKTHQLRVHMNSLGLPIDGDPLYPIVTDVAADDYRTPLQLLSRRIEFDDPITGEHRRFESNRSLPASGSAADT